MKNVDLSLTSDSTFKHETFDPVSALWVRTVRFPVSGWTPRVPHHAVNIQPSAKESAVPHAEVRKHSAFVTLTFWVQAPLFCLKLRKSLCLQSVSSTERCMLKVKCSPLLGVDPASSAGVRQVCATKCVRQEERKTLMHLIFKLNN